MRYTPNSPQGKLQWVLKTYGEIDPIATILTVVLAAEMMGLEEVELAFRNAVEFLFPEREFPFMDVKLAQSWLDGSITPEQAKEAQRHTVVYTMDLDPVPRHFRHDRVFPWIARELHRASFETLPTEDDLRTRMVADYGVKIGAQVVASDWLRGNCTAIAQWSSERDVDLMRVTLAQAMDAIKDYEPVGSPVPTGEVVYRFEDGWTVERLTTPEQLTAEGQEMQHCVGEYVHNVETGHSQILSLRDPQHRPHVTMEWWERQRRFYQVRGKQNRPPVDSYARRVREFIGRTYSPEEAIYGLMLTGTVPQDLRKAQLSGVVLEKEMAFREVDLTEANLIGSQSRAVVFERCSFRGTYASGARFGQCSFRDCDFSGMGVGPADAYPPGGRRRRDESVFGGCEFVRCLLANMQGFALAIWAQCVFLDCEMTPAQPRQLAESLSRLPPDVKPNIVNGVPIGRVADVNFLAPAARR